MWALGVHSTPLTAAAEPRHSANRPRNADRDELARYRERYVDHAQKRELVVARNATVEQYFKRWWLPGGNGRAAAL